MAQHDNDSNKTVKKLVNAIIEHDGHNLSLGSFKTLNMIIDEYDSLYRRKQCEKSDCEILPDRTDEVTDIPAKSAIKTFLKEYEIDDQYGWTDIEVSQFAEYFHAIRLAEVLTKAGKHLISLDELGRDYNQDYESSIRFLHHEATTIIASLQQSNEQKDREMIKAKQLIKELLPLAEDAHKANVRSGVGHQEFIQEDSETISDARKFLAD